MLADQTRRRIVELLATEDLAAGEVAAHFDVSGPAISRHLRVLREAEVVHFRRDGQKWVYSLNLQPLLDIDLRLQHNVETWQRRFAALGAHLDDMRAHEESEKEAN